MFKTIKKTLVGLGGLITLLLLAATFNNHSPTTYLHGTIRIEPKKHNKATQTSITHNKDANIINQLIIKIIKNLSKCDKPKSIQINSIPPVVYTAKCFVFRNQDLSSTAKQMKLHSTPQAIMLLIPLKTTITLPSTLLQNYDIVAINAKGAITHLFNHETCNSGCTAAQLTLKQETLIIMPKGTINAYSITNANKVKVTTKK